MKIVLTGKKAASLTSMVKLAASTQSVIVADSQRHWAITNEADQQNVDIHHPITYKQFVTQVSDSRTYAIDNVEQFLNALGNVEYVGIMLKDSSSFSMFIDN